MNQSAHEGRPFKDEIEPVVFPSRKGKPGSIVDIDLIEINGVFAASSVAMDKSLLSSSANR